MSNDSITLYHNPNCSKSREVLNLLKNAGIATDIRLYLDSPPSLDELKSLQTILGMPISMLMRTGDALYAELGLADNDCNDNQRLNALLNHPQLLNRPIVSKADKACICRPPETVLDFLED